MMIRIAAKTNKVWKHSSHLASYLVYSCALLVIASFNTLSSSIRPCAALAVQVGTHLYMLYPCRLVYTRMKMGDLYADHQ